jgi:hypothetical protein
MCRFGMPSSAGMLRSGFGFRVSGLGHPGGIVQTQDPRPQTRFSGRWPPSREMVVLVLLMLSYVVGCQNGGRCLPAAVPASRPAAQVRYFFVVPQDLPGGGSSAAQCKALEIWLARKAGGYTRLGPCKGGWMDGGRLAEEDNIAYLVFGPVGLKPQIERIIIEQFQQREALVAQW